MGSRDTFLGLPRAMPRSHATLVHNQLQAAWSSQFGALGDLEADLRRMSETFDPIAQGDRLRRRISEIPATDFMPLPSTTFLFAEASPGRFLITPEGRVALEWLSRKGGTLAIADDALVADLLTTLAQVYRDWTRQRFDQVVALLAGKGPPMLPQAIAAVLLLLMNRSTKPERAIVQPTEADRQQLLDLALQLPIEAFVSILAPSDRRQRGHFSFYGGYALTEARRRLGTRLVVQKGKIYVRENEQDEVLTLLARELARRDWNPTDVRQACHAMQQAYGSVRPQLAAFGVAHERPIETERLWKALEDEMVRAQQHDA